MTHTLYLLTFLVFAFIISTYSHANYAEKKDGEFVTLTGKVTEVSADAFRMQMNGQSVIVEMDDDDDWGADGYKLTKGDQVVVSGKVDQDFLERKKVEAGSVYVKSLDTYFHASHEDEEGAPFLSSAYTYVSELPDNAVVDLQGKVTEVDGREFTLNTGMRKIRVDTSDLSYNPMDNKGSTKISTGDRVRVSGKVDEAFFEGKEVNADYVAELR